MNENELNLILDKLLSLPAENECFELKTASKDFNLEKLGQYFSALSNEANLKNKNYSWLILGIDDKKNIKGTNYENDRKSLDDLKNKIAVGTNDKITFIEIYELERENKRIIMFQIPPASLGIPVAWKGHWYGRNGESLDALNIQKIETIRHQKKIDWSANICESATLNDLDNDAIEFAKIKFKEGKKDKSFYNEIDNWDIPTFLDKARLTINGSITNTSIILLGKPESKRFIFTNLRMVWKKIDNQGINSYEHFDPPFLLEVNNLFKKISNDKFKILPENSIIPIEISKYEPWIILEALNNCIAHQNYETQERITVTEENDELTFYNAGNFFKGKIEDYIFSNIVPSDYRNQFLVDAMENLGMIDTIGSGIKQIFNLQKKRFLPLPDYWLKPNSVTVTIYGHIIDNKYTETLIKSKDIDLETTFNLDKIQKNKPIPEDYYTTKIIRFLENKTSVSRADIDNLLIDKLDFKLTEKQKKDKIKNLLHKLKDEGKIKNISQSTKKPIWKLVK